MNDSIVIQQKNTIKTIFPFQSFYYFTGKWQTEDYVHTKLLYTINQLC